MRISKYMMNTMVCCVYDDKIIQYSPKLILPLPPSCVRTAIRPIENEVICDYDYQGGMSGRTLFAWEVNGEEVLSSPEP